MSTTTPQPYDSRPDTLAHRARVYAIGCVLAADLERRLAEHDASKMADPELATFDEYTPKLQDSTYGSPEYYEFLAGMKTALDHHYANNRHHPEHHRDGVLGMTLVDLIEMLVDWRAATERHANGSLDESLSIQQERFSIPEPLMRILRNTADYYQMLDKDRERS